MDGKEKIEKALLRVALGYQVAEVTEEYAEVDGELKLTKRKKTKKDIPPDLKAVQLLLTDNGARIEDMSDEELENEKKRLLAELGEAQKRALEKENGGQVCVEKSITAKKKSVSPPKKKVNKKGENEQ